jgi:flagellar biosynthetic protein FliP
MKLEIMPEVPGENLDTVVLDSQVRDGGRHGFSRFIGIIFLLALVAAAIMLLTLPAQAVMPVQPITPIDVLDPAININVNGTSSDTVRVLLLLTLMTLLPSFLLMMTCFTRIVIIFSLLRNAIGLQQTPPNQVMIGLALLISLFIMAPVINEVNETAYRPFSEGTMNAQDFIATAQVPLKKFMLENTTESDFQMFIEISRIELPDDRMDYPITTIVPAFMTSEIKRAFLIGFLLYIPFLIIDMVTASALMSMGMMMLPPITISLPFKLMLFVLVDGWGMLIRTIVMLYRV